MIAIEELYELFAHSSGVVTDSRNCPDKSIFFALKGDNFDGNQFAAKALESGASYAVVDDKSIVLDERFLLVEDVLATLQKLAYFHRLQLDIPIIAITGTNGKTTTKELITAVLSKQFKVCATIGNLNNHIGVPLTLLRIDNSIEMAVVEMGANHPGEIEQLCKIAMPEYGLITNVGKAHLEGFGSFEGVMKTKAELYESLKENEGAIFMNSSNEFLTQMLKDYSYYGYGIDANENDIVIGVGATSNPYLEVNWKYKRGKEHYSAKTNLAGIYNYENVLAAITIGYFFGVETDKIVDAISNYKPQNNRSQIITTAKNRVLMDAYNANPSSMEVAIDNFKSVDLSDKFFIIGEMLELGEESEVEHQNIVNQIIESGLKNGFFVGKSFSEINLPSNFRWFENVGLAIEFMKNEPIASKTVLVKGSRGNRLELVLEHL